MWHFIRLNTSLEFGPSVGAVELADLGEQFGESICVESGWSQLGARLKMQWAEPGILDKETCMVSESINFESSPKPLDRFLNWIVDKIILYTLRPIPVQERWDLEPSVLGILLEQLKCAQDTQAVHWSALDLTQASLCSSDCRLLPTLALRMEHLQFTLMSPV